MSRGPEYNYDLAISFKEIDKQIANDIYNRFKDRLNVFYYDDKQRELAGDDLLLKFEEIFTNSKSVVVLLNQEYGIKGATKVERDSIYHANLERGWDTTIVINMEDKYFRPKWIPKGYNILNYKKYGLETIIGSIEDMIMNQFDSIEPESVQSMAKRLQENELKKKKVVEYINGSFSGALADAQNSARKIMEQIKYQFDSLLEQGTLKYTLQWLNQNRVQFKVKGHILELHSMPRTQNMLYNHRLCVRVGNSKFPKEEVYKFRFNIDNKGGWIKTYDWEDDLNELQKIYSTQDLISEEEMIYHILKNFIDLIYGNDEESGNKIVLGKW